MVAAAAKNHAHVGIVVDPAQYSAVLDELAAQRLAVAATKRRLARDAFAHTAAYDAAIVHLVRRDRARGRAGSHAAHHAPGARAGPEPSLRREPAPARGPVPQRRLRAVGGTTPSS
ncbi:MAG: hypothetical protein R2705_21945 [Ilumatobacteraceae bacterium]